MRTVMRSLLVLTAILLWGCARSPHTEARRRLASGKTFYDRQDYARAALEFRNAIQLAPGDAEPYYRLGLVFEATDNPQAAIHALRKATELNPNYKEAQLKMARLMAANGSRAVIEQAEDRALAVLSASGEDPDALNTLALAETRLGKPEAAQRYLQRALDEFPEDLRSSVNMARLKLLADDGEGALVALKQAVQRTPQGPMPKIALGDYYLGTGRPGEARPLFDAVLSRHPQNGLAMLGLASVELQAGHAKEAEDLYRRVSALPNPEFKPVYAHYLFQSGRRGEAVAIFQKLLDENPNDRGARSRLVLAYLSLKRNADAERVLGSALKRNSKDVDALLWRGALRVAMGRAQDAQMDLSQVLRYHPDSAPAHFFLSRVHREFHATLSQRAELLEALRLNPDMLPARVELAESLMTTHSAKNALDLMNGAPPSQRNMPGLIAQQNWALMDLGNLADARQEVDRGLAISRTTDLLLQDALLKTRQKQYAAGRAAVEEALRQNPEDTRLLRMLMKSYEAEKRVPDAWQRLRKHGEMFPGSARILEFTGSWLAETGNPADARRALNAAKSVDPNFTPADISLARLDVAEYQPDAARKRLADVLTRDSRNATARLWLGHVEEMSGNLAAAIEEYRKVLTTDPNNIIALNNLAYYLADYANQPDEALKYAQKVKEIAPGNAAVDDTIGWAFLRKGLYSTALKHLEAAALSANENGGRARARYHLAIAYYRMGKTTKGDHAMRDAAGFNPNMPERQMAQKARFESAPNTTR